MVASVRIMQLAACTTDETINQFNTTVLTAVQEVDNAMSSYKNSIKQIVACREMLNQGKRHLNFHWTYTNRAEPFPKCVGCTAFVTVIREFIGAGTGIFIACLIQMYQALGGGWQTVTEKLLNYRNNKKPKPKI